VTAAATPANPHFVVVTQATETATILEMTEVIEIENVTASETTIEEEMIATLVPPTRKSINLSLKPSSPNRTPLVQ
jgi:hypothetical protein